MEKYLNQYEVKEDCVLLHIFGLKNEATLVIEKDDYERISSVHWGLMGVGKVGWKKIIPYTCIERASVPLGRWLLHVHVKNMRVEHKDRNNLNFLRSNLYVIAKNDVKQQVTKKGGVYEAKQHNGKITGYKVEYRSEITGKKEVMYFSAKKYNGLENAKKEAFKFKLSSIQQGCVRQSA